MSKSEWLFTAALVLIVIGFGYTTITGWKNTHVDPPPDYSEYEMIDPIIPHETTATLHERIENRFTMAEIDAALSGKEEVQQQDTEAEPGTETEEPKPVEPAENKPVDLYDCIPMKNSEQRALLDTCDYYNIPYFLVLGIIEQESNFDSESDNGISYGYMQLNRNYFPSDLKATENIKTGIEFLHDCLVKAQWDIGKALTIYNAGHDDKTRIYADAVFERAMNWKTKLEQEENER